MQNQRRSVSVTLVLFLMIALGSAVVLNSRASAQSSRAWTSAGSTGTLDEDSTVIAQLKSFSVTLVPGAIGTVRIRYNITPTAGISSFCPATQSQVRIRFRNSDESGAAAKVAFEIHSTDILVGGNNTIYTFDSNGKGAGAAFTTFTDNPAIDFNFATSVYWIEATIYRNDANRFADLGSIQIAETGGTPCP